MFERKVVLVLAICGLLVFSISSFYIFARTASVEVMTRVNNVVPARRSFWLFSAIGFAALILLPLGELYGWW